MKNNFVQSFMICILGAGLLSGCSNKFSSPADVEYDASQSPYHRVKRDETLSTIAREYNIDMPELARLNGIKPPYRIMVGQKLIVRTFSSRKPIADDFDMPVSEEPVDSTGEVKVYRLAPLSGTQEEHDMDRPGSEQPFSGPGGLRPSDEDSDDEDMKKKENEEGRKAAKELPKIPKSDRLYSWPVEGKNNKRFNLGKTGKSEIKISAPMGTTVMAANNGIVAHIGQMPAFGKLVILKHDDDFMSIYTHMDSINVKRGDVVSTGQKIGKVGKSGNVSKPQLGFEIRKKRND